MSATSYRELFPHEADVGVRGIGSTLAQAFEQAALAMTAEITDIASVQPKTMIQIAAAHHTALGKVTLSLRERKETLPVSRSYTHLFRQM